MSQYSPVSFTYSTLSLSLSLSLTLSHSHTHTERETHTRTFYLLFHLPVFFLLFIDDLFLFFYVIDLMVLILYFLWYMNMQLFRLHVIFFSPSYLIWHWPFNGLRSEPSLVCIHPIFACWSLPISSLLPPSLRCLLLHTVDKAMARICIVFLVTSEIHHSRHYYKKDKVDTGKGTLDPLSGKLLCSSLDHATPLWWWSFVIPLESLHYEKKTFLTFCFLMESCHLNPIKS